MTEPTLDAPGALRERLYGFLRTLRWAMLTMSFFYIGLGELLRRSAGSTVSVSFFAGLGVVALIDVLFVLFVCMKKVARAEDILRIDAEDRTALIEIRKWFIVALVLTVAVTMDGFVMRISGSTFLQACVFYAAGIAVTLYCAPPKPQ